jgi:hypothetical protein
VRAYNAIGTSGYSNEASTTTTALPTVSYTVIYSDDGGKNSNDLTRPGTLSYALNNITAGHAIDFSVATVNVTGPLPPVKAGVYINVTGSCGSRITISGSNLATNIDGLVLSGNAYLKGLIITNFTGIQIKAPNTGNMLVCTSAVK